MKRLFKALILMGILFPVQVFALGLGELETQSALNQPFKAELQILRASPAELKGLQVKLASHDDYARIGLERLPILNALSFKLIKKSGLHYIRITSRRPISEPYLNFLIEVNWSKGRMLREFTVLLDPPELLGAGAPELSTPEAQAPEAQVKEPEAADSTAKAPTPVATVASPKRQETSIVYGPVKQNEQLWNIASEIKANRDATVPQVMMALLRNNPQAFIRDNVNNLKRGHVLRIENPQDIYAMDAEEASEAFSQQYQLWRDYKQSRAEAAAKAEAARVRREQKPAQTPTKTSSDSTEGVLTLERPRSQEPVSGHLESSQPGSGKQTEQIGKLREQLAAAEESAELSHKRNEDMHERLMAMEEQIASLQRLMELKSDELVALQETQREEPQLIADAEKEDASSSEPEPSSSMLSELQKNPQLMGLLGGTVLLLLTMFWVIARKRRSAANGYRFESNTSTHSMYEEPDYGVSAPRKIEEDPLTQADIFVAYGNLDAAINLMSSAVEKNPENSEYQTKLNDLAAMLDKRDGVIAAPESASNVLIPEQELIEEESLLTSDDLAAFQQELENNETTDIPKIDLSEAKLSLLDDTDRFEALLTLDENDQQTEPTAEPIAEKTDFDLGELDEELQQLTTETDVESKSNDSVIEFDLNELDDISELANPETDTLDEEIDTSIENELDRELDEIEVDVDIDDLQELEQIEASVNDALDNELDQISLDTELPDEPDDSGFIEIGDNEPDLLNSVDEVGTKLDLARAYIDMGDPEGARSILDEVLLEGNENQIAQAHELLDQI